MSELNKKQSVALAVLAGLNILFSNVTSGNGHNLNGEIILARSPEMHRATLITCLFGLQLFGFIIGAFAAIVPYRQKLYSEKWVTFSLWICIAIQSFFVTVGIVKLITKWF